jgi:aminodeoxyfutalosine deaminase
MQLETFIRRMPKVELHVHLEGSIRPETLLTLAARNRVSLPVDTLEGLREWYNFTDFDHFIEVYFAICACLRTPEDFETITAEFLANQAAQNIRYSEVIWTPYTHHENVSFDDQLAAINRARETAERELGVRMALAPDLSRHMRPVKETFPVVDWAIQNMESGIIGFGLGGPEIGNPPEIFQKTFERAYEAGLPSLPHAGETDGPASIWGALDALKAVRIGHGIRCLEDPKLVAYLREHQIPLEVCPSSNVCLGGTPSLAQHPLPRLLEAGLFVTINSDDPPMFDTTLTDEYLRIADAFGYGVEDVKGFVYNGIKASLLLPEEKAGLQLEYSKEFDVLERVSS